VKFRRVDAQAKSLASTCLASPLDRIAGFDDGPFPVGTTSIFLDLMAIAWMIVSSVLLLAGGIRNVQKQRLKGDQWDTPTECDVVRDAYSAGKPTRVPRMRRIRFAKWNEGMHAWLVALCPTALDGEKIAR
jgi:hypothetical protein